MFFAQSFIFHVVSIFLFCTMTQCVMYDKEIYLEHAKVINLDISDDILTPVEDAVRDEVVKVRSSSGWGTGTLFNINGAVIAITASHVINDDTAVLLIDTGSNTVIFGDVIYNDVNSDIAIILTNEIGRGIPLKLQHSVAGVGTDVFTFAHPNMHSKMLMRGEVSGFESSSSNFYILLQGFAWPGSSGASIFDDEGNLVGILSAVDIGRTSRKNSQLVPEIVWVKPSQLIDLDKLQIAISASQN